MKRILLSLSFFALIACFTMSAADQVILNFDGTTPTLTPLYGATISAVANPDATAWSINTSANCGKIGRTSTQYWEKTKVPASFTVPASTTYYVHLKVKCYAAPVINIETTDGGTYYAPTKSYYNIGNWQELVFAISASASPISVSNLFFLADIGTWNTSGQVLNNTTNFLYVDEIIVNQISTVSEQMIINFDGVTPTQTALYGSSKSTVTNPVQSGINTSANCGKIGRTETANYWEIVQIPASFTVPAYSTSYVHIMVKYDAVPNLSLRWGGTSAYNWPKRAYDNIGAWQDIVWEITAGATAIATTNLEIAADMGGTYGNINGTTGFILDNTSNFGYYDNVVVNQTRQPRTDYVNAGVLSDFESDATNGFINNDYGYISASYSAVPAVSSNTIAAGNSTSKVFSANTLANINGTNGNFSLKLKKPTVISAANRYLKVFVNRSAQEFYFRIGFNSPYTMVKETYLDFNSTWQDVIVDLNSKMGQTLDEIGIVLSTNWGTEAHAAATSMFDQFEFSADSSPRSFTTNINSLVENEVSIFQSSADASSLTISFPQSMTSKVSTIKLYNLTGALLCSGQLQSELITNFELPKNISKGLYLFKIEIDGKNYINKVLLK